jgi:hypothetical protein
MSEVKVREKRKLRNDRSQQKRGKGRSEECLRCSDMHTETQL